MAEFDDSMLFDIPGGIPVKHPKTARPWALARRYRLKL
jgi:hypothetical protein